MGIAELKAHARGESGEVTIRLAADAFSVWDEGAHTWTVYPGTYTVSVGSSSRDLRAKATIAISR
jgi:beta-glucosidase